MSCDKHDELKGLLERVDERTGNMQTLIESYFKTAQWVLGLLIIVVSSVIAYNIVKTDNLSADTNIFKKEVYIELLKFKKGVAECDFSEYTKE